MAPTLRAQIIAFSPLAWLFLHVLPAKFGLSLGAATTGVSVLDIALSVGIYLGIPFLMGVVTRYGLIARRGREWFEKEFHPCIAPLTLLALLWTVAIMFSLKAGTIAALPGDVLRIAAPLCVYFTAMFVATMLAAQRMGATYPVATSLAFTATGNNFELAVAVCISTFGIHSGAAFAAVVGPLVEVPALICLVGVAGALKRWIPNWGATGATESH